MIKKIFISLLIFSALACQTGPGLIQLTESEIERSLIDISISNIDNLLDEGENLKAVQLILSVNESEPEYYEINQRMVRALTLMDESFTEAVDKKDYREAIKYYKSYQALEMPDKLKNYNLVELQIEYVNKLFEEGHDAAAVSYLYDHLEYSMIPSDSLIVLERQLLDAENHGALKDLFDYYVKNSINALPETIRFLSSSFTKEKMISGTVTVWVNKGIKIENGIGIPDRGIGSGFFIDNKGHILTNYHVISSEVDPEYEGFSRLFIKLSDNSEERIPAKVIGWDREFDVALLKTEVTPEYLFSVSKEYEPVLGDKIFAIGSPGGLKNTITSGTVSSLSRQLQPLGDSLQIDVPINPGNSGGPLLNSKGEVIGIIFAGIEQFEGVNFAIPVSDVKESLPDLYSGGEVSYSWLGCGLFERSGVLEILYVLPGSPAEQIGLQKNDIITSVNGMEFSKISDIQRYIIQHDTGTIVRVNWQREDGSHSAVASLDERPDNPMEIALARDAVDNLFVPFFGMETERIKGKGNNNVLYNLKDVYPGSTADEAGLSVGDSILLRKWTYDEDNQVLIIQIIMKSRKAGFIESAVQVGTYIKKGFLI